MSGNEVPGGPVPMSRVPSDGVSHPGPCPPDGGPHCSTCGRPPAPTQPTTLGRFAGAGWLVALVVAAIFAIDGDLKLAAMIAVIGTGAFLALAVLTGRSSR